jgi:hypothetical protein
MRSTCSKLADKKKKRVKTEYFTSKFSFSSHSWSSEFDDSFDLFLANFAFSFFLLFCLEFGDQFGTIESRFRLPSVRFRFVTFPSYQKMTHPFYELLVQHLLHLTTGRPQMNQQANMVGKPLMLPKQHGGQFLQKFTREKGANIFFSHHLPRTAVLPPPLRLFSLHFYAY